MEERTTKEKIIFAVLDVLLIVGAIFSILTIDRGQWLIANPALYQPPGEDNFIIQATPANGYGETGAKIIPQTGKNCLPVAQLSNPQWYDAHNTVSAANMVGSGGDQMAVAAQTPVTCGQ